MRKKILAVAAAVALGTTAMTTGAMAFGGAMVAAASAATPAEVLPVRATRAIPLVSATRVISPPAVISREWWPWLVR